MRSQAELPAPQAGPLSDGLLARGLIICPLHGYKFELRDGPGRSATSVRRSQTYRASVMPRRAS